MGRKPRKPGRGARDGQWLAAGEASITREVDYTTRRAQEGDARVVTLGALVLFSAAGGDAWVLDPEEGYALCLARGGVRQPARVVETEERFAIEWDHTYRIERGSFVCADRSGRSTAVAGYPTREIVAAVEHLGQAGPDLARGPEGERGLSGGQADLAAQREEGARRFPAAGPSAAAFGPPASSSGRRLGRNDPCWCGSGKKYKHCHLRRDPR